ncbi:MAG: MATE family efflux transporter [Lentisphaeria bacterium]|nr:MATE family efflux transporter [Lentisphaeria bacterium]
MAVNKNSINLSEGPLTSKIIRFAIPLAVTHLLNLSFHAADTVVIGRWGSAESMGAIGAVGPIVGLLVNFFAGLSTGVNVLAAQFYGAKDSKRMTRLVHTSTAVSLICGVLVAVIGCSLVRWVVQVTGIPEELQSKSILYLLIIFAGLPFQIFYAFICAVLRAIGDTKSPLYFLIYAGVANIVLNIVLVVFCKMDVAGVAIGTIASHIISVYLGMRRLMKNHGSTRLILKNIRIDLSSLRGILGIGTPAGVQGACFSLSNIVVQSGVNSLGAAAIAGSTAEITVEWLIYAVVFSLHHTVIAVVGQNFGARKFRRLIRSLFICLGITFTVTLAGGWLLYALSPGLISIFTDDTEVIRWGILRAKMIFSTYFLLGIMDFASGALRGLGCSLPPALATILGTCGARVLWAKLVFPRYGTMESLLMCYPVSWILVAVINLVMLYLICRSLVRVKKDRFYKVFLDNKK